MDEPIPFLKIQAATRIHRREHGCGAYTFEDGPGLIKLAQSYQPSRILELGTALGYTACCLAFGHVNAAVDTVEGDALHVELAQQNFVKEGLSSRIQIHHGNFRDVLPTLTTGYDMVFFDGFAPPLDVLVSLKALLIAGGVLICSNLELIGGLDVAQLEAEFSNTAVWNRQESIEFGKTAVLIKK
ncbi:MAG: class I SAM-dependent methyltransferase [Chloroflexota bacterium]